MKSIFYSIIFLLLCLCSLSCDQPVPYQWTGRDINVALVPFGDIEIKYAQQAKTILERTYHCQVTILKNMPLPDTAWYAPRERYQAETLIRWLGDTLTAYDRVAGITNKDIAIGTGSRNWGVFGYGYMPGRSCVISTFRLARKEPQKLENRFQKVVIHEFGHTLGLDHCSNSTTCFMRAAEGKIQTLDEEKTQLCEVCSGQLGPVVK